MFAKNPRTGAPITGSKEVLSGQAVITSGTFACAKPGQVTFEYSGDTEVYWDDQRTEMQGGERIFVDALGHEVAESVLVLVDDAPEEVTGAERDDDAGA